MACRPTHDDSRFFAFPRANMCYELDPQVETHSRPEDSGKGRYPNPHPDSLHLHPVFLNTDMQATHSPGFTSRRQP